MGRHHPYHLQEITIAAKAKVAVLGVWIDDELSGHNAVRARQLASSFSQQLLGSQDGTSENLFSDSCSHFGTIGLACSSATVVTKQRDVSSESSTWRESITPKNRHGSSVRVTNVSGLPIGTLWDQLIANFVLSINGFLSRSHGNPRITSYDVELRDVLLNIRTW